MFSSLLIKGGGLLAAALTLYNMATFKVKTFNELSGKGQNGDIAIIERADINGNQGFAFRDASGWSLPFVQVTTLGANLMTTNTSQSISAPKTFQGEITINDDFSVIGATDIDLGFAGTLTIDGDSTGEFAVNGVENVEFEVGSEFLVKGSDTTTRIRAITNNPTVANDKYAQLDLSGVDLNIGSYVQPSFGGPTRYARLYTSAGNPASELGLAAVSNHLNGTAQTSEVWLSDGGCSMGVSGSNGQLGFGITSTILPGLSSKAYFNDSRTVGSKFGIEYSADYSATLKTNARSLIDAGTMTVMLEDYIAASPTYADNAAAVTGGLAVGKMYKTATGELRIVV